MNCGRNVWLHISNLSSQPDQYSRDQGRLILMTNAAAQSQLRIRKVKLKNISLQISGLVILAYHCPHFREYKIFSTCPVLVFFSKQKKFSKYFPNIHNWRIFSQIFIVVVQIFSQIFIVVQIFSQIFIIGEYFPKYS